MMRVKSEMILANNIRSALWLFILFLLVAVLAHYSVFHLQHLIPLQIYFVVSQEFRCE